MTLSELRKEDYLGLSLHFVLLVLCLLLAGGMFYGVNLLDTQATRQLNLARGEFNNAQASLDQIEQEEQIIRDYLAPYRSIEAAAVNGSDRLDMQEEFAQIRARYSLFPIQLSMAQEVRYTLPYPAGIAQPGAPVDLLITRLDSSLPLLHENDLAQYLEALVAGPSLLLPTNCRLDSRARDPQTLLRLGQHLNANCSFVWYKFQPASAGGRP
jgi:hypothetical protein